MISNLPAGARCLLDNRHEVKIVKAFNKVATKYVVETSSRSVILVETARLKSVDDTKLAA